MDLPADRINDCEAITRDTTIIVDQPQRGHEDLIQSSA